MFHVPFPADYLWGMCFSIPAKVVEVEGRFGTVDWFGRRQRVLMDLVEAAPGDHVYVQGGIAVALVPEREAEEVLRLWEAEFDRLERTDKDQSAGPSVLEADLRVQNILGRAVRDGGLSDEEAMVLLGLEEERDLRALFGTANRVRSERHGNACCVHGIVEFSNRCGRSCAYCGISVRSRIGRYAMSPEEILETAREAVERHGFRALVLQSGEDSSYDDGTLVRIVEGLRSLGVLVFLSVGVRPVETYRRLYEAGARACLLRFETSNPELFRRLKPDQDFEGRLGLLRELKRMGYVLATGFLVGLPGATPRDLIADIRLTAELGPDMWSFGPFLPVDGTPLEEAEAPDFGLVLKAIAVSRLVRPDANILVTTAMEALDDDAVRKGLQAGANSLMVTLTPRHLRGLYRIYDRPATVFLPVEENVRRLTRILLSLGRSPMDVRLAGADGQGFR